MSTVKANEYRHLNNSGTEPNLTLSSNASVEVGNDLTIPQGNVDVTGNATISGNITANGNAALGNAATDAHTVTGTLAVTKTLAVTELITATAGVKGDIKSPDGTTVLDNGTGSGTDSTFTGNAASASTCSGNAATATKLAATKAFSLTGDVTASAINFDGSGNVTLATSMANNSVDLGTHTTGNYIATITAGQVSSTDGITVTGSGSESAAVTIKHADTSSASTSNNSGQTFIQDITIDTYGHITAIGTGTASDTNTTYTAGSGLSLNGTQFNVSGTIAANVGTSSDAYSINGVVPRLPNGTGSYGSIYITGNSQSDTGSGNNNVVLQKSMVSTLASNSLSYQNVVVGNAAGGEINGGNANTLVGYLAGNKITSGDDNVCIGDLAGFSTLGPGGRITTASDQVIIGNNSTTNAYIKVTWQTGSDKRDKTDIEDFSHGLDFIKTLKPVTYRWDNRTDYLTGDEPEDFDINSITRDGSKKRPQLEVGLIAQDVLVEENKIGYATDEHNDLFVRVHNTPDSYGMVYERLTIPLINAVKELSDQVEKLTTRVAALEG